MLCCLRISVTPTPSSPPSQPPLHHPTLLRAESEREAFMEEAAGGHSHGYVRERLFVYVVTCILLM